MRIKIMKITKLVLLFCLISIIPNSRSIFVKPFQCSIGITEATHFSNEKNRINLISYSDLRQHILKLIKNDPFFTQTKFINTSTLNGIHDSLILKNGSCIKFNLNNTHVDSVFFVSHNHRMEWEDTEILMKILKPFNQNEYWYSADIYKIAVNLHELNFSKENHTSTFNKENFNIHEFYNFSFFNKQSNKLTFMLYKTQSKSL